ncbi:hypothetical protein HMPREF9582_02085 [Cutibacterium acnes HL060PA1]|nr:hypothetical protein HMPREF9582_02085 [Cutibacterium acnes HL060PA1]
MGPPSHELIVTGSEEMTADVMTSPSVMGRRLAILRRSYRRS